jgi:hypothetical protein
VIKLKGFLTHLTMDVQRYTKTLDANMEIQTRQAARAWLRAVIEKVPVWTGMARGSLKPIGGFLKIAIPISPVAVRKGMGPAAGASRSTFFFGKSGTKYQFRFNENVLHYAINEFFDVNPPIHLTHPGEWHSFEAGAKAWQDYIENVLPGRLPKFEDIIVKKVIRIK